MPARRSRASGRPVLAYVARALRFSERTRLWLYHKPTGLVTTARGHGLGFWHVVPSFLWAFLGDALGVPPLAMAELLPVIEAVMVAKLNEQMDHSHG